MGEAQAMVAAPMVVQLPAIKTSSGPCNNGVAPLVGLNIKAVQVSKEMALLLACVRWPVSPASRAAVVACAQASLDWPAFVSLVERHRMFALVDHTLRDAKVIAPPETAEALHKGAAQSSFGELSLVGELRRILSAFQAADLKVLTLKGIAVSILAFGQIGLRFNRDIDLLVDPDDVEAASKLLESADYLRVEPAADASPAVLRRWMERQKDLVYVHRVRGFIIELHWRLFDNRYLLPVSTNLASVSINVSPGFSVRSLTPQFNLVYLCAHGAQHGWSRLKWLADVNAILARMTALEFGDTYALAKVMGVHRPVAQAALLCTRLMGLEMPASVFADIKQDRRIRMLERAALHCIFDGGALEIEDRVMGSTRKNISHYLMADGLRYRMAEVAFDLTDVPPVIGGNTPSFLLPFVRPALWLSRQVRALTRTSDASGSARP